MGELVQVVGHPRRVPEQGHEQVPAGKEKDGEHSQQKQRQQPAPQRHLPQRDASIEVIPFHKNLLLGVLAPAGSLRAKIQSPDSRIDAPPLAFPPGFAAAVALLSGSLPGHSGGTAPDSHRLPVPLTPPACLAAQHSRGPRARQPPRLGRCAAWYKLRGSCKASLTSSPLYLTPRKASCASSRACYSPMATSLSSSGRRWTTSACRPRATWCSSPGGGSPTSGGLHYRW